MGNPVSLFTGRLLVTQEADAGGGGGGRGACWQKSEVNGLPASENGSEN